MYSYRSTIDRVFDPSTPQVESYRGSFGSQQPRNELQRRVTNEYTPLVRNLRID